MDSTGRMALITGASSGVGLELARVFARHGVDMVLVARRRERLESLARELEEQHGIRASALAADLTRPSAPTEVVAELQRRGSRIDYLVNNAGIGSNGPFAQADLDEQLRMVTLNVTSLMQLTRLLLPPMLERRDGRILNIGSVGGFMPGPFMAGYYASKAFVVSFTEALAFELRGSGVSASVVCPGPTETEFAGVAGVDQTRLFVAGTMKAATVAVHAYQAMMEGRALSIPGLRNKLSVASLRITPRAITTALMAMLHKGARPPALAAAPSRR